MCRPLKRRATTRTLSFATALLLAVTPIALLPAAPVAAATSLPPSVSLGKTLITIYAQNLRSSASAESAVTGAVRAWESVGLLDATAGWVKVVNTQGQVGWLRGNAVRMWDTDLPFWVAPVYQVFPGSWEMNLYPTRAVGTWVKSAPIRSSASPTSPVVTNVPGGTQIHLLSIPADEFIPVRTEGGAQGWISRYQLMGAPTLARTEESFLEQIAPDRFRLTVRGHIGAFGISDGAFRVALPDEPNRRGNLAVKTAGVQRLLWEPSGLIVPLTGEMDFTVVERTTTSLIVELGPVSVSPPEPPTEPKPTDPPQGPLAGKTVILDPGHGGEDPGASGNGLVEKLLNLEMANRVSDQLEAEGARVVLTRTTDARCGSPELYTGLTLYERGRKDLACRAELTAKEKGNLFISIHYNSLPGTTASGTETYYSPVSNFVPESQRLAGILQTEVVKATGLPNRGVRTNDFYVITYTEAPSALVEIGFLSNATDAAVLAQTATKERVATALTQSVIRYFE